MVAANVLAWPLAYWSMDYWLQDFAYRIDLGVGELVLGGALTLLLVMVTVSFQAIKAALSNPVDALRYE
jgi:putative ABC transport system permease protein